MRFYTILQIALLISFVINVHFSSYAQILPFRTFENDSGVAGLIFTNDGTKLIAGGHRIHIWDIKTGTKIKTFNVEGDPFYSASSVALSPSEKYVVVGGPLPYVTIWDINTEKIVARAVPEDFPYKFWNATNITAITFTNDEENIIIGDLVGNVSLWDWKKNVISKLFKDSGYLQRLNVLSNSNQFMTHDVVYSLLEKKIVREFNYIIFPSSDGKKIYSCYHNKFLVHDSETFDIIQSYPLDTSSLIEEHKLVVSPTGDLIIMIPENFTKKYPTIYNLKINNLITLWNTSEKQLQNLNIYRVSFSCDGKMLAAIDKDNIIYIFDISTLTSSVKEAEAFGR